MKALLAEATWDHKFPNGYFSMNTVAVNDLLQLHSTALSAKHITTPAELLNIMYFDFEKVLHALVEKQLVNVDQLLEVFFIDHPESVPEILSNISDRELNHIGFEICEPLDVVAVNLEQWLAKIGVILGKTITLRKQLRFPASATFCQRVGAVTEILCLWLSVDKQPVKLELFDIARPIHVVFPSDENVLTALQGLQQDAKQHRLAINYLFQNDRIWHYSINVENRQTVVQLHENFKQLVAEQPHYKLAYTAPIKNSYDHSFHTKIINLSLGLELEFINCQTL